jgi:hypothetical protein
MTTVLDSVPLVVIPAGANLDAVLDRAGVKVHDPAKERHRKALEVLGGYVFLAATGQARSAAFLADCLPALLPPTDEYTAAIVAVLGIPIQKGGDG